MSWDLYTPFRGMKASAEFTFATKHWKTNARLPTLRSKSYSTNRYATTLDVGSIELASSDFLVFKHKDFDIKIQGNTAGKVVLSYPHIPRFLDGLADTVNQLADGCFEQTSSGEFKLTAHGETMSCEINDLFNSASIGFQPIIFQYEPEDGEETDYSTEVKGEPGVRMFLNSWDFYCDARLIDFRTFITFYERFDLFATSRSAVTIASIQGVAALPTMSTAPQPVRNNVAKVQGGLGGKVTLNGVRK